MVIKIYLCLAKIRFTYPELFENIKPVSLIKYSGTYHVRWKAQHHKKLFYIIAQFCDCVFVEVELTKIC